MLLWSAYILGTVVLAMFMAVVGILAIAAFSEREAADEAQDSVRALWAERRALRILRARYAAGQVNFDEYRRLTYELEEGRAA